MKTKREVVGYRFVKTRKNVKSGEKNCEEFYTLRIY